MFFVLDSLKRTTVKLDFLALACTSFFLVLIKTHLSDLVSPLSSPIFLLHWAADLRYGWPSTCCLDVHEHPKTKKRKNAQLASASVFSCSTNPEVITSIP